MPVTDRLVPRAAALAWDHGLRAYDAIQLAAVLTCNETVTVLGADTLFNAFDRRLRDAAIGAGLDALPE